jgi:transcriptional regulator GlxA family with amidase domain
MIRLAIPLVHQYKLLSVAAILEVFDTVNKFHREEGKAEPFQVCLVHMSESPGHEVSLFAGYESFSLSAARKSDLVLIPAFTTTDMGSTMRENLPFVPWLNRQFEAGAEIASVCTGIFLFAATGLLDGKIATTHVDASGRFAQLFPAVDLRPEKTVTQDGRLYTSGGATSTFHLLLRLVQQHCGKDIAVKTAKVFAIDMDRDNQSYFGSFQPHKDHHDELVATAQQKIETNYHDAVTIEELIRDLPSSRRNIVRRFKQVTGITPIEYLQQTRVEAAKRLLEQTNQQMTEVIFNSGYNDLKAFRKVFKKTVGMTPSEYREKFQAR